MNSFEGVFEAMFKPMWVVGMVTAHACIWGQIHQTVLYSVTAVRGEPVDISYDADISVGIDAKSSAVLRRAEANARDGVLHVRAFEGLKAELKNISKRERDVRTGCVKYFYEHRPQVIVDGALTLNGARANKGWLREAGDHWEAKHWVLVPDDGSQPQGYTWVHEGIVKDYFDGGIEIVVRPGSRMPPPESRMAHTGTRGDITGVRGTETDYAFEPSSGTTLDAALIGSDYSKRLPGLLTGPARRRSGELPPGLALTEQGVLHGKPTKEGIYTFVVAQASAGRETLSTFKIEVEDPARFCILRFRRPPLAEGAGMIIAQVRRCAEQLVSIWHLPEPE